MNPSGPSEPVSPEGSSRPGSRRTVLAASVGLVAAAAGAGFAWWRHAPAGDPDPGAAALWPMTFETPAGTTLSMKDYKGRPLLVNFWATWCPPCVEEMPLLDRFQRQHAANGWQVVGLAIDQPSAVRSFLGKVPVGFPIGLAGLGGTEIGKSLGNLSGGLPFTVVFAPDGSVVQRKMGQVKENDLQAWVEALR